MIFPREDVQLLGDDFKKCLREEKKVSSVIESVTTFYIIPM